RRNMMAVATGRPAHGLGGVTQAARSYLRLTGVPMGSLDTSAPISACGYLLRMRVGESILVRLEGVGLLRAAAVSAAVSGGIAAVGRLSLYDYTITAIEAGEGMPSGRVVFLDGSRAWVPFAADVPFTERHRDDVTLATVGLIRVEDD